MPETDILNPTQGWDPELGDSMNPSFGFSRKRGNTQLRKKAVGGSPWSRETQNTGHTFSLSWLGRTLQCVRRLKRYYEQYEDGYFTIIDWDGGGRHYVGRFTTEVMPVETAANRWDVQNVIFEEMPRAPMVQYPGDWDEDAVTFFVKNDFGEQKLATSGTWTPTQRNVEGKTIYTMDNPGNNSNDFAQFEYRGYGFKLYLMQGPEFGQCTIILDETIIVVPDGLPPLAPPVFDCYAPQDVGPQVITVQQNLPLDIHRVKVYPNATKNANATGTTISWHSLQVMR